jgi:hypothetical protein
VAVDRSGLVLPSAHANSSPSLSAQQRTAGIRRPGARRLGGYTRPDTQTAREVIALPRADASTLVLDCERESFRDARLVARLAPEEPEENARILCELYLADPTRGRCRALSAQDLAGEHDREGHRATGRAHSAAVEIAGPGYVFAIRELPVAPGLGELRWTQRSLSMDSEDVGEITLRHVIAAVEDYEPARSITLAALIDARDRPPRSSRRLREELHRLSISPIVLNRLLRETVHRHVAGGLTMSEIAMRCGRTKRDRAGQRSGETSWLARRIGEMSEAGRDRPTGWVHSDTLALIARDGLGVSPHEVEL